jgi:cell division protein FtsB
MSLDGLRAWIGLVEQKLAKRTRVFLVLVAIAVGLGGAALYLAIDAQDSAVSEADLQDVRDELAGQAGAAPGAGLAELEAEVEALQGEVATLRSEGGAGARGKADGSTGALGTGDNDGTGGAGTGDSSAQDESSGTAGAAAGGATVPKDQQQLEELVEKAQEEADGK